MTRVLVYSIAYPPDSVSTGRLLGALTSDLTGRGYAVEVVTTTPHHRPDGELSASQVLRPVINGVLFQSEYAGARVWHIATGRRSVRLLRRLAALAAFHALSSIVLLSRLRRADLILVVSPPLTLGAVGGIAARLFRVPMVYNVQELYPDFLINQGFVEKRATIAILRKVESFVYASSHRIAVIGERFRRRVMELGVPESRIVVIPNFSTDPPAHDYIAGVNPGRSEDLVVYYGGNIGLSQDWELLLEVADRLRDVPVRFVISGDGARAAWLRKEVEDRMLSSVDFVGSVSLSTVAALYAQCDVVAVPMKARACLDTFPSKLYSAFAAGRPVIISAEMESDAAGLVAGACAGIVVPPADCGAFVSGLRYLLANRETLPDYGQRGLRAVRKYDAAAAGSLYDLLIDDVLADR